MSQATPRRKRRWLPILILILVPLCLWLVWGNTALMVTEYTVSSDRLPAGFDGYRIAQVSDLHNASFGEDNEQLLSLLSEQQPDIILLTGDLVDSYHTDVDVAISFGAQAAEIAPVYYVPGNHESRIGGDYDRLRSGLVGAGVTVLENDSVTLTRAGDSVRLLGIVDPSFSTDYLLGDESTVVSRALTSLTEGQPDCYTILLSHRPELLDCYAGAGMDLVFTGHAHGGQFRLPFVGGVVAPGQGLFPQYDAGTFTEGQTTMVVSRGLGNSIIPLRVNNRPELVVVTLECED